MRYFLLLVRNVTDRGAKYGIVLAIDESGEKAMAAYVRYMGKFGWEAVSFFETNAFASIEEDVDDEDRFDLCSFPEEAILNGKPWLGINPSVLSKGEEASDEPVLT